MIALSWYIRAWHTRTRRITIEAFAQIANYGRYIRHIAGPLETDALGERPDRRPRGLGRTKIRRKSPAPADERGNPSFGTFHACRGFQIDGRQALMSFAIHLDTVRRA
jgi:hypothetical protein